MCSLFPLFRLLDDDISRVLNFFDLNELFKISIASKRSFEIAKLARNKSRKVNIILYNGMRAHVSIETNDGESHELVHFHDNSDFLWNHEQLKIGDMVVPINKGEYGSLNTYWKDQFVGITKVLDLVSDFFDSPIHELVLGNEKNPKDIRQIVDWVMTRQKSIPVVYFESHKTEEEELKYFLDTCKITDDLALTVKTSEQFKYTINFELENLMLKHAHWLTFDNLLSLNCRFIAVDDSTISSTDVNLFLKLWVTGCTIRLGMLILGMNNPDIDVITAEMNAVERTYDEKQTFKYSYESDEIGFKKSYDIKRLDGVMGSIVHHSNAIKFLVWPDWDNQPYSQ